MIKTQTITLPSNLRVLVSPMPSTDSVTVMILVRAGSRFETAANNGIAHFLEHMFFKGGTRYPTPKAVSEAIDSIGGSFNAFTGHEYVGYYVKVAKHHIATAFDVLSDMLLNAHLDTVALNREKKVILEEYHMYQDNPRHLVSQAFDEILFGDTPLGWEIIGTPKNIKSFTQADVAAYKSKLYTAGNIVVAVAGNTTAAEVKKLVGKYLPYPKAAKLNTPAKFVAKPLKSQFKLVVKDTEQAHLILGTHSFSGNHPDRYAAEVLATILGGGMSSRLFSSVREELALAYYIYAYQHPYTDTGYFAISAGVDKTRIDVAIGCILAELDLIAKDGVESAELKKAKDYLIGHMALELEASDEIASYFGAKLLLYNRTTPISEVQKQIQAVTMADVHRLAKTLFTKQSLVLTVVGPKSLSGKIKSSYKLKTT
jgi:predicted Zn-dependent peptidase